LGNEQEVVPVIGVVTKNHHFFLNRRQTRGTYAQAGMQHNNEKKDR